MDLTELVRNAHERANEALKAFNAGHQDRAEKQLMAQMLETGKYFDQKTTPAGDVTETATSEKPAEIPEEKPAEVPGAPAQPAATPAVRAAQQFGLTPGASKPTQ